MTRIEMSTILNIDALRDAPIHTEFFPYCQVDCFINKDALKDVLNDFPNITVRGSVPAHKLVYGANFQRFIDELSSPALRDIIAEKFSIDLSSSETMLTIRGQTTSRDGRIHTDTPSKLMTLLIYLNEDWAEPTGNLRLLKDGSNLENYFDEVIPTAGKLLVFKVTDNCWHGHHPFVGARKTLQLNYVTNKQVVEKEMRKHSRSFSFKKLINYFSIAP